MALTHSIMMNSKGFFFFKFDTSKGLEDVLETGPWMIRNSFIILKKWTINTSPLKEELTRIPIWVKIHDIPLQVFSEDGISLIATKIGKPIMLDSYTSSMCIDSWGRSSFARCLIEVKADDVLKESMVVNKRKNGKTGTSSNSNNRNSVKIDGHSGKLNVKYVPKAAEDENVFNKSINLLRSAKTMASSSNYMVCAG
ncbi:zinc knuckle CX2CX4HX4C containing protein [Tanacetum coccineum]